MAVGSISSQESPDDIYVVKINSKGAMVWEKQIGGITTKERAHSIKNLPEGGFIITGNKWEFIVEA